MDKLRACIVANYYASAGLLKVSEVSFPHMQSFLAIHICWMKEKLVLMWNSCLWNISFKNLLKFFIDWFWEREKETSVCYSTYLCVHWLFGVCVLTRDWTCNFGISGQCSNQLSYPARAWNIFYIDLQNSRSLARFPGNVHELTVLNHNSFFFLILTWGHFFHCFLEREGNIEVRKKHWLVASHMCLDRDHSHLDQGPNPPLGHVPLPGIKPTTFQLQDDAPTNWATWNRATIIL